jgi:hypothetical protein
MLFPEKEIRPCKPIGFRQDWTPTLRRNLREVPCRLPPKVSRPIVECGRLLAT